MLTKRALAAALIALLVIGCASDAIPTGSPTDEPSLTAQTTTPLTETAAPTAQLTATARPTPTPSPALSFVSGLEASDRFWANWYETCFFGVSPISSSLAELTDASAVIVRGTIADLTTRHFFPSSSLLAVLHVSPSEVLKGDPIRDESGNVQVEIGLGPHVDTLRTSLPPQDHLWFLRPNEDVPEVYLTTDYQQVSVFRDIDGVVQVIMPRAIGNAFSLRHFPVPLDGTSFEELVQRVRDLTSSESASPFTLAAASKAALERALLAC